VIGALSRHVAVKPLAEELRECRLRAGLTQVELASLLGVTDRTVKRWEAGKGRRPGKRGTMHTIYVERIRALPQAAPMPQAKEATVGA